MNKRHLGATFPSHAPDAGSCALAEAAGRRPATSRAPSPAGRRAGGRAVPGGWRRLRPAPELRPPPRSAAGLLGARAGVRSRTRAGPGGGRAGPGRAHVTARPQPAAPRAAAASWAAAPGVPRTRRRRPAPPSPPSATEQEPQPPPQPQPGTMVRRARRPVGRGPGRGERAGPAGPGSEPPF